jgi:hypothetical protein
VAAIPPAPHPNYFIRNGVVLVAKDIAYPRDAAPTDFKPGRFEFIGQTSSCFRDDLNRALDNKTQFPVGFEFRETRSG